MTLGMSPPTAQTGAPTPETIWGCGPVAQFTIKSAWMFGAGRVIAIDGVSERLEMARTHGKAETIDTSKEHVSDRLLEMTNGRGPDRCIDVVGCEAHGAAFIFSKPAPAPSAP
jgi:threonine dehydrogenase-like Zn-dependent dehydrogenase